MSKLRRVAAIWLGIAACSLCAASPARAGAVFQINDQSKMEIGIWAQGSCGEVRAMTLSPAT
jgi:hypothetical protein